MELGYHLSAEEHGPDKLVRTAVRAEEAGFTFALVSDHYHPWLEAQGESPFVWVVVGMLARATRRMRIGTGVTCPTMRMHPAIVAHAAATAAVALGGRFFLGVGSGEWLNEHILGGRWPPPGVRLDMLEEAIQVIRALWSQDAVTHRGTHFTVEDARLYTRPDRPPPLLVAASGPRSTSIAAEHGDGVIAISPDVVERFVEAAGQDAPRYAKLTVCWAQDEDEARRTALRWWGNDGMGPLGTDLRTVQHFEAALARMRDDAAIAGVLTGPDPERYVTRISELADAGVDHLYLHQVGPEQDAFIDFFTREVRPHLE